MNSHKNLQSSRGTRYLLWLQMLRFTVTWKLLWIVFRNDRMFNANERYMYVTLPKSCCFRTSLISNGKKLVSRACIISLSVCKSLGKCKNILLSLTTKFVWTRETSRRFWDVIFVKTRSNQLRASIANIKLIKYVGTILFHRRSCNSKLCKPSLHFFLTAASGIRSIQRHGGKKAFRMQPCVKSTKTSNGAF